MWVFTTSGFVSAEFKEDTNQVHLSYRKFLQLPANTLTQVWTLVPSVKDVKARMR